MKLSFYLPIIYPSIYQLSILYVSFYLPITYPFIQAWVQHFDRKYHFEKFKLKMKTQGYEAIDAEHEKQKKRKEKSESTSQSEAAMKGVFTVYPLKPP